MKKVYIIAISIIMLFSMSVTSFANNIENETNINVTEEDVINAINAIDNEKTKNIILDFLTTPIYVEVDSDSDEIDMNQENQKALEFITRMSSLPKGTLDSEINNLVDEVETQVTNDPNSYYTQAGLELFNNYDPDFKENVHKDDTIENAAINLKDDMISTMATYPDRTRTKSNTWAYKSGSVVLMKGTMKITWVVKNNKITKSTPGFSYSVNKTFYKFSHWKTVKNSITNNGQRANVEITAYFTYVPTGIPKYLTPGVWVYNDGGCDFHLR